jgi:hypothetical protein
VDDVNYWYSLYFWGVFPVLIILGLAILYLLPIYIFNPLREDGDLADEDGQTRRHADNRMAGKRNFWRLSLFFMFLVYPTIASTVLRTFVCVDVEDVWYLRADFSITCYDDAYTFPALFAGICTLLYPIGIPLFFLGQLTYFKSKGKLELKGIRARLGFLYDGYTRASWWFEIVDMLCKLTLSALIAFVPFQWQMLTAMCVCALYISVIEYVQPYIRKADNRLHMIALVEILLMLMAGNVFNSLEEPDELMDAVLSVVLIGIVCGFFAWWLLTTGNVAKKLILESKSPCVLRCIRLCNKKYDYEDEAGTEEMRQRARAERANAKHALYDGLFAVARVDLQAHSTTRLPGADNGVELKRNALHVDLALHQQTDAELIDDNVQSDEALQRPKTPEPQMEARRQEHEHFDDFE